MLTIKTRIKSLIVTCCLTLFVATPVWAEDIEIYTSGGGGGEANIVFIIDTSGSMSRDINGNQIDRTPTVPPSTPPASRLESVQEKFKILIDDIVAKNVKINAAVMRFDKGTSSNNLGGYFVSPMQPVNANTQAAIIKSVTDLTPEGFTPLAETLYEATLYFQGASVNSGKNLNVGGVDVSNQYISPITNTSQCEVTNHVVLLTDGKPTVDGDTDTEINALLGPPQSPDTQWCGFSVNSSDDKGEGDTKSDDCLDELAGYLATTDQSTSVAGNQFVNTYTIGFGSGTGYDKTLLQATADMGHGKFFESKDAAELATAFMQILDNITMSTTPDTMVAPTLTVNNFNRLTHMNEVYFSLFKPAKTKAWPGNVKGYVLGTDPNDAAKVTLLDANGQPAIVNGVLVDTATSLWTSGSDAPDGGDILKGGAASKIPVVNRKVFTYTGNLPNALNPAINADLTSSMHKLDENNALITPALLGLPAGTVTTPLIQWARGLNSDGVTQRHSVGDPLHSQPLVVTYGGNSASPKAVLYVATNEGFLHAIDVESGTSNSGVEKFAFIPPELLPNLDILMNNSGAQLHPYGLDGGLTSLIIDNNKNGTIDIADNDKVYLYVGMRRGGNNYYAFNVTNPDQPILKWVIKGGIATTEYAELGQTWSKPTVGKIKLAGADTDVLIFGGGYALNQDSVTPAPTDSIGRAIFIVNADTGERIWWAGPAGANSTIADMTHSIPSDVRALDINLDGYTDRLYVGDMNGRVFRVDIDNDSNSGGGDLATVGLLASLSDGNHRRFYNAPDVALTSKPGSPAPYLSINLGSGYRAHPLDNTVQDRFYALRDYDVFTKPATYPAAITNGTLYDATANDLGQGSDAAKTAAINDLNDKTKMGWYINLNLASGEKILASSTTYDNKIFFTTYTPAPAAPNTCSTLPGIGKLYGVSLFDATPVQNSNAAPELTQADRLITDLEKGGIPSAPAVAFLADGPPTLLVGDEAPGGVGLQVTLQKTYWQSQ